MALSNDGLFIVYNAVPENPGSQAKPQIYLRKMDQMEAAPVAGTEGGISPFLSPDDRWIGFWHGGKLKKVAVSGGLPATLCEAASPFGAHWGPDNTIVFCPDWFVGLSRISSEGGQPQVLTVPDQTKEEYGHRLPRYLPDGRGVLFTVMAHGFGIQPRLALLDLKTGQWRVVVEDAADGRYLRTGHLAFLRQGTLMAVTFDLNRLEVKGQPVPVANVMQALDATNISFNTGAGQYNMSDAGWLAYVPGGILPDPQDSLIRVDQKGNAQPVADFKAASFACPRFSPDGQRIAYMTQGKEEHVWIYDLSRGTATRLMGDGRAADPIWMPDGKRVVFGWSKSGQPNSIWWQSSDGSSPMEQLTVDNGVRVPGSFTPDGSTLAFVGTHPQTSWDILLLDIKTRRVKPFLNSKAAETYPEISPDGRWLAYVSDESGRREVWVRPFAAQGGKWQISNAGGREPIWSRDGKQLFYRQSRQVWVADVRTGNEFSAGKPRLLFEQQGFGGFPNRNWDLAPDGRSFLMGKPGGTKPEPVTELILVQNWFEELKRLVPTEQK